MHIIALDKLTEPSRPILFSERLKGQNSMLKTTAVHTANINKTF